MADLAIHSGSLPAVAPFEFRHSLEFMAEFGPLRDSQVLIGECVRRALLIGGQVLVYQVAAGVGPTLDYTLWSDQALSAETIAAAADGIAFTLSLSDDLAPFYALAQDDSVFRPIVEILYGYHQVKFPSAFENAVWAVLSQRNTLTSARTMRSALARTFGGELRVDGQHYWAFPEPEQVAQATPGEVARVIGHAQKGPAVAAVAEAFAQVDERWLRVAPYEQAERWLLDIYGIGPWGASFVLVRGLGRMERLPKGERKLLAAIGHVYQRGGPVTEREAAQIGARYGAYQGYWAHYLRVAM